MGIKEKGKRKGKGELTVTKTICVLAILLAIILPSISVSQDLNEFAFVGKVYQVHLYKNSGGGIYQPRVFVVVYDTRNSTTQSAGNQPTWFTCLTGCTNVTNLLGCPNGSPVKVNDITLDSSGNHVEVWECPFHVRGHCAGATGFINFYGGLGDLMVPIMLTLGFDESWCNQ